MIHTLNFLASIGSAVGCVVCYQSEVNVDSSLERLTYLATLKSYDTTKQSAVGGWQYIYIYIYIYILFSPIKLESGVIPSGR